MKKSILAVVVLMAALSSCTKDYSCECTEKESYLGLTETYEYDYEVNEATKAEAIAACNEATIVYSESDYSYETTCELKK